MDYRIEELKILLDFVNSQRQLNKVEAEQQSLDLETRLKLMSDRFDSVADLIQKFIKGV